MAEVERSSAAADVDEEAAGVGPSVSSAPRPGGGPVSEPSGNGAGPSVVDPPAPAGPWLIDLDAMPKRTLGVVKLKDREYAVRRLTDMPVTEADDALAAYITATKHEETLDGHGRTQTLPGTTIRFKAYSPAEIGLRYTLAREWTTAMRTVLALLVPDLPADGRDGMSRAMLGVAVHNVWWAAGGPPLAGELEVTTPDASTERGSPASASSPPSATADAPATT